MATYVLSNGEHQVRVGLAGSWLAEKIVCPWCQDAQACCVSTRQGLFYCFACGISGMCTRVPHDEFLAEYQELSTVPGTPEEIDAWLDSLPDGEIPEAEIEAIVTKIRQAQENSTL